MKIKSALKKIFTKAMALSRSKGFTLIELLIVIAVLGVLAASVVAAIDPIDKINSANDSKVQTDVSAMGRASENYATTHGGLYNATLAELESGGELKRVPSSPSGYSTYAIVIPAGCTSGGGTSCTSVVITGQLKSKRFTATPFWRYESSSGKSCAVATAATSCP